jgi:hypothetical protein
VQSRAIPSSSKEDEVDPLVVMVSTSSHEQWQPTPGDVAARPATGEGSEDGTVFASIREQPLFAHVGTYCLNVRQNRQGQLVKTLRW